MFKNTCFEEHLRTATSACLIFIVTNTLLEFSPFFKNYCLIFQQFLNFKAPFSSFSYRVRTNMSLKNRNIRVEMSLLLKFIKALETTDFWGKMWTSLNMRGMSRDLLHVSF